MKKIYIYLIPLFLNLFLSFVNWAIVKFPYENWATSADKDPSWIIKQSVAWSNSVRNKITKWFLWSDGIASKAGWAMSYIQSIINIALWLVGFIALVMIIYWFFMMLFSKEDEWIKNAKSTVKNAAIALILIWLSRTIVYMMFWWVSLLRE